MDRPDHLENRDDGLCLPIGLIYIVHFLVVDHTDRVRDPDQKPDHEDVQNGHRE